MDDNFFWKRAKAHGTKKTKKSTAYLYKRIAELGLQKNTLHLQNVSDEELVAVVAINVLLKTINERIINTRLNNQGSAVLVDRNLNIIAREGMSTSAENWADPQKIERFSLDAVSGSQIKFEEELKSGAIRPEAELDEKLLPALPPSVQTIALLALWYCSISALSALLTITS